MCDGFKLTILTQDGSRYHDFTLGYKDICPTGNIYMFQLLPRSGYMIVAMFYRFIWYSVGVTPSNSHFKDVYKDWLKERIKVRRFREYQHFILSFSLMENCLKGKYHSAQGKGVRTTAALG
ncbi:hypothetical protein DF185_00485 [Marinifilum breve]|uniref:Uncharacterized protein n=1 Tax=Marinifilum breve TaxID=2184082 RepID=A0A2V4AET2_9BACT|nr:hypothetical protein DF185_00485 [Marinifilum breve]